MFIDDLMSLNACSDAVKWASTYDDPQRAWDACERGDWMMWLVGKMVDCSPWSDGRKPLLACALDCAETVKHLWRDERIAPAVVVLRKWIAGRATRVDAEAARKQLYAAYAAYAAAYAAYAAADVAYAAYAAAYADAAYADAAYADVAYAAYAAANVAYAAAAAAYAAAAYAAGTSKLKQCADIVRRHYPVIPTLRKELPCQQ